ncbi:hypothetical protein OIU85_018320 [Salix viminalis]|uniref:DUF4283 domain-containing protein n=1 Tax=Salix viminalis TaxID=40686 RepID=A0A9Q0UTH8_SALVM|nr:hypothetical protein OIU85_018320 [Salix viminalis]
MSRQMPTSTQQISQYPPDQTPREAESLPKKAMAANNQEHANPANKQTITWADRVRVTNSTTRHTLEDLPQQPAGTKLVIPADMKMHSMEQWSCCMVGFFTGYKPPYQAINLIARKAWGPHGLEEVSTMADGFLIFRFATEEAVSEVIEKGPWMIGGKNIILQKWTPKFQFDRSRISALPVWVRLRGLPLPLWTKEGLSMAASMLGKPLSCDEQTISCRRLDYARLCVELDASLPFVHKFEVESPITEETQLVRVEYEWKPPRCMKCHSFGHNCTPQTEHIPTNKLREEEMPMEEPTEPAKGRSHPGNPNPNQEKEMSAFQATNNHTGSTSSAPKTKKITTNI